jgi:hypothetical protein
VRRCETATLEIHLPPFLFYLPSSPILSLGLVPFYVHLLAHQPMTRPNHFSSTRAPRRRCHTARTPRRRPAKESCRAMGRCSLASLPVSQCRCSNQARARAQQLPSCLTLVETHRHTRSHPPEPLSNRGRFLRTGISLLFSNFPIQLF